MFILPTLFGLLVAQNAQTETINVPNDVPITTTNNVTVTPISITTGVQTDQFGVPYPLKAAGVGASDPYFYVPVRGEKCFYESLPTTLPMAVTYHQFDPSDAVCSIDIYNQNDSLVASREVTPQRRKGKLAHVTSSAGQYSVCVQCKAPGSKYDPAANSMIRYSLLIDLGDMEIDASDEIAKLDEVHKQELQLKHSIGRLQISNAQNIQYEQSVNALISSSRQFSSVYFVLSSCQLLVVIGAAYYSINAMRNTFRQAKVI